MNSIKIDRYVLTICWDGFKEYLDLNVKGYIELEIFSLKINEFKEKNNMGLSHRIPLLAYIQEYAGVFFRVLNYEMKLFLFLA